MNTSCKPYGLAPVVRLSNGGMVFLHPSYHPTLLTEEAMGYLVRDPGAGLRVIDDCGDPVGGLTVLPDSPRGVSASRCLEWAKEYWRRREMRA